ncbi:hypothetical protein OROMI_017031 [Orobanche minor]
MGIDMVNYANKNNASPVLYEALSLCMLMDLISLLFPSAFVFIVCLGSISRSFIPSLEQVSVMEHVLTRWMTSWRANNVKYLHQRVSLGVRISSLNSDKVAELSRLPSSCYNKAKYMLLARKGAISIIMHRDSAIADGLHAFMHALVLAKHDDKDKIMHTESQSWMAKHSEVFVLKLQLLGWGTESLLSASLTWKPIGFTSSDEKVE